jgi:hypothetical protein
VSQAVLTTVGILARGHTGAVTYPARLRVRDWGDLTPGYRWLPTGRLLLLIRWNVSSAFRSCGPAAQLKNIASGR